MSVMASTNSLRLSEVLSLLWLGYAVISLICSRNREIVVLPNFGGKRPFSKVTTFVIPTLKTLLSLPKEGSTHIFVTCSSSGDSLLWLDLYTGTSESVEKTLPLQTSSPNCLQIRGRIRGYPFPSQSHFGKVVPLEQKYSRMKIIPSLTELTLL